MSRAPSLAVAALLLLAGCASAPAPDAAPWRDADFAYDPKQVAVGKDELFRLPPEVAAELRAARASVPQRVDRQERLKSRLFDAAGQGFLYRSGLTTVAAQTWRDKRGDCLSLTVLAYAMARELGLPATMQDVRVPMQIDRRGEIDYLNRHVNLLIPQTAAKPGSRSWSRVEALVIDFEPGVGSFRAGTPLTDDGVLARYYNNRGAEHYARDEQAAAYAYYKAAIQTDRTFSASYGNLAQLYLRRGYADDAERLLRQAVALTDEADLPLWSLHRLLLAQGRTDEAARIAQVQQARRERDPYYWLGVGVERIRQQDWPAAIAALERAQAMTTGFDEVHRYLALAYWRAGDTPRARAQWALLEGRPARDPAFVALAKKIDGAP
jgi:tetratricopeptide (TPR) repeat protein